jgi:hypothetical protein
MGRFSPGDSDSAGRRAYQPPAKFCHIKRAKRCSRAADTCSRTADTCATANANTSWESYIAAHRVARATLVKLPPFRDQLIRLPQWGIRETRPVMMPYNIEVLATYRGDLDFEWQLPTEGNHIGDMWVVGRTPGFGWRDSRRLDRSVTICVDARSTVDFLTVYDFCHTLYLSCAATGR